MSYEIEKNKVQDVVSKNDWDEIVEKLDQDKNLCLQDYQKKAISKLLSKNNPIAIDVFLHKIGWISVENNTNRPLSTIINIGKYEPPKKKKKAK